MKKAMALILISIILCINAFVLTYKYSFFSEIIYKVDTHFRKKDNLVVAEQKVLVLDKQIDYDILETFDGTMTAYGSNCIGCSGVTAFGYDIRNNNIYYEDKTFGNIRIVAADKKLPFGTVVRISGLKIYDEPILAVVLDRGGAIRGNIMDLAFGSEDDELVKKIGRSNVKYDILRYGW